jgi:hypothetical protein
LRSPRLGIQAIDCEVEPGQLVRPGENAGTLWRRRWRLPRKRPPISQWVA